MQKFRYLHIRDGYQKGNPFDGYKSYGYWTVEQIIDENGVDVVEQGLFLEPNAPKKITVVISAVGMENRTIKPVLLDLPPFISYTPIPEFDPSEKLEFETTLTCNTKDTILHKAKVSGQPLPARTKAFSIYCSFGWTVGNVKEVGWDVGQYTLL